MKLTGPNHSYHACRIHTLTTNPAQHAAANGDNRTILKPDPNIIDLNPSCAPAPLPGDHSVCVPPDPFSNSAVKPVRANGTNAQALEE